MSYDLLADDAQQGNIQGSPERIRAGSFRGTGQASIGAEQSMASAHARDTSITQHSTNKAITTEALGVSRREPSAGKKKSSGIRRRRRKQSIGAQLRTDRKFAWIILFALSYGFFAQYYAFDNVTALSKNFDSTYNLSSMEYNLLYSIMFFPQLVQSIFLGVIVDKYGMGVSFFFAMLFTTLGQFLFALACQLSMYPLMLVGRAIFALGLNWFGVVEGPLIGQYFQGGSLALAMGINLAFVRFGSASNDFASTWIAQNVSFHAAIWFSLGLIIISHVLIEGVYGLHWLKIRNIRLAIKASAKRGGGHGGAGGSRYGEESIASQKMKMDREADEEKRRKKHKEKQRRIAKQKRRREREERSRKSLVRGAENKGHHAQVLVAGKKDSDAMSVHSDLSREEELGAVDIGIGIGVDVNASTTVGLKQNKRHADDYDEDGDDSDDEDDDDDEIMSQAYSHISGFSGVSQVSSVFEPKQITMANFDSEFWLLQLCTMLCYPAVLLWMNVSSDLIQNRYGLSQSAANALIPIPYLMSGFLTPMAGALCDWWGHCGTLLAISAVFCGAAHVMWAMDHDTLDSISIVNKLFFSEPYVPLVTLGLGYSLWGPLVFAAIPKLVEPHVAGTAFGIAYLSYGVLLAIGPLFVGGLTDTNATPVGGPNDKYQLVELMLAGISGVYFLACIALILRDRATGSRLEHPKK